MANSTRVPANSDRLAVALNSLRVPGGDCDEISTTLDPAGGEFSFSIAISAQDGRSERPEPV